MKARLLPLLLLAALSGCGQGGPCLELRIAADKPAYREGEPVNLSLTYVNGCRMAVAFYVPRFDGSPTACSVAEDEGTGAWPGAAAPRKSAPPGSLASQKILAPGQHYAHELPLQKAVPPYGPIALKDGVYSVSCGYRLSKDDPLYAGSAKWLLWLGETERDRISVEVENATTTARREAGVDLKLARRVDRSDVIFVGSVSSIDTTQAVEPGTAGPPLLKVTFLATKMLKGPRGGGMIPVYYRPSRFDAIGIKPGERFLVLAAGRDLGGERRLDLPFLSERWSEETEARLKDIQALLPQSGAAGL